LKYFWLVWAALRRKPLESVLLLAAVSCAFTLLGLMVGLRETARQVVAGSRADRIIINPRYDAPDGLPSALMEQIARFEGVTAVGLRNSISGYPGDPDEFVWVDAVDQGMRRAAPELPLSAAQWDRLFANPSGVYLSSRIAERLQLRAGDRLTVTAPGVPRADGGTAWDFDVLDIVADEATRGGNLVLGNYGYLDNQRPESVRGHGFIVAAVSSPALGDQLAIAIDRHFANSGTATASITFRAAQENMDNDGLGIAVMTWGIGSAGLFMILLLVGNAIAQSVRERIPEFAVLKALGFRHWQITALVVGEAMFPCAAGAVAGMGLAWAISLLPRSALPSAIRGQSPTFSLEVWMMVLGLSMLLALLGALLPAWRLRRMKVAAALVTT
jgi:putative ABC transport system permease protein